jgi:hypothetical protein
MSVEYTPEEWNQVKGLLYITNMDVSQRSTCVMPVLLFELELSYTIK